MSWDAENIDRPLIMLEHTKVAEAISGNAYELDDDLQPLGGGDTSSEVFIGRVAAAKKIKDACDYLAFSLNRRVAVWWASQCVKELRGEEKKYANHPPSAAAAHKAAADSSAAAAKAVADEFAAKHAASLREAEEMCKKIAGEIPIPPGDPAAEIRAQLKSVLECPEIKEFTRQVDAAVAALSPQDKMAVDQMLAKVDAHSVAEYGKPFKEAFEQAVRQELAPPPQPSSPSEIELAGEKIRSHMNDMSKSIQDGLEAQLITPPGLPKSKPGKPGEAFDAAMRWVIAPTDANAMLAKAASDEAPNTPEGMLAMAAFWSGNNLSDNEEQRIVPPPGLAARGIVNTIYLCAMAKGGKLNYDERYEIYLELGLDAARGVSLWDGAMLP